MRLHDGNAELQSTLVLYPRCTADVVGRLGAVRCRSGRRTHKMSCVDLNPVAPLGAHFAQSHFGVFEEDAILNISEADGDA